MLKLKESWDTIFDEIPEIAIPIISAIYNKPDAKIPFMNVQISIKDTTNEYPDGNINFIDRESRVEVSDVGLPSPYVRNRIILSKSTRKYVKDRLHELVDLVKNDEGLVDWVQRNVDLIEQEDKLKNPYDVFKTLKGDIFSTIFFIKSMMKKMINYEHISMLYVVEADDKDGIGIGMPIISYIGANGEEYYIDLLYNKGINKVDSSYKGTDESGLETLLKKRHHNRMFGDCDKYPYLYIVNIDRLTPGLPINEIVDGSVLLKKMRESLRRFKEIE